jgi:anaerobic selenocysteine-containing dehydrogenase
MDRRNFFRILSATSAGAIGSSCGRKTDALIPLLVPEQEIPPGEELWRPAACTGCGAGCGVLLRIMEAERIVDLNGEKVRQRIAAIKKVEGNPLDPVSGGRLCARGQAAVQSLYHPDRLRGPMKRTGQRGKAQFTSVSWDEAMAYAAENIGKIYRADPSRIAILTGAHNGTRAMALEQFAESMGAPAPVVCSPADFSVERRAAEAVFGWKGLPVYDLAHAHHVLSVGADFLGGWNSPVYYNRQYGAFRQARQTVRGRLVHAESRLSLTAGAADKWLPLRPGTEPQFLAAVGRMLLDSGLARDRAHGAAFAAVDPSAMLASCGLTEAPVREFVKELGESAAPLVIGGASVVQSNSLDAIAASHYLNLMLGNVAKPGGLLAPAKPAGNRGAGANGAAEALARAGAVLIADANPAYTVPPSTGVLDALARAEIVIGFGNFVDDSAAWCDLLLPTPHEFESEIGVIPAVAPQPAVTMARPFVKPLYDTRALESTLSEIARRINVNYRKTSLQDLLPPEVTAEEAVRQGGWWEEPGELPSVTATPARVEFHSAAFAGDPAHYPLAFQPYPSLQFQDGSGSNLPWMQELPDPASSSMWGLPVEVDGRTAAKLGITTGDTVRVESPYGWLEAAAYVHPGAIPGVVSMGIGDGHTHFGQYASGRGANPISILAPAWEAASGALVLGGTRVRLSRTGRRRSWIQFSAQDREERGFEHR